jgi:hypothetical protein
MEIIVESRRMKAGTVLDMAFDLGLDRPRISTVEEWNGSQAYILTFGPPAYRRTAILRPSMSTDQVTNTLMVANAEAMEAPPKDVVKHAVETRRHTAPPDVAENLGPNPELVAAKPQKRKAAKSRA